MKVYRVVIVAMRRIEKLYVLAISPKDAVEQARQNAVELSPRELKKAAFLTN